MKFNKVPYTNLHGFNLDWVIKTVQENKTLVDGFGQEIENISDVYITKEDLTNKRKLSETGIFSGNLANRKTALEVVNEIDNNRNQIQYIASQFSNGQTGFVIDGGFFTEEGIKNNYNGGVF